MAGSTQKGQTLVELTFVLIALVTFALLVVTQWKKFSTASADLYFSNAMRVK